MKTLIIGVVILIAVLLCAHVWGLWRFGALLRQQVAALENAAPPKPDAAAIPATIPAAIRCFAERNGAGRGGVVQLAHLTQEADLRLGKGADWQALRAEQWFSIASPGFVWRARLPFGPIDRMTVIDAFTDGRGLLQARLLGSVRVANATGADIDRGEAMRYLAELPWIPDAMLGNRALVWADLAPDRVRVALGTAADAPAVTFHFDAAGDIVRMTAKDRPSTGPDGKSVLLDWVAEYRDYAEIGGRRIPLFGEVGYVYDDGPESYWRGRITGLTLIRE